MLIKKLLPVILIFFISCNNEPSLLFKNYQQDNDTADYYIEKGEEYLNNNSLEKAEFYFRKALKLKNEDPEGLLGLADVYFRKYLFKKAITYAKKVIKKHPENKKAYKKLSEYYLFSGDIDNAILAFQDVIKLDPDDYQSTINLYYLWKLKYGEKEANKKLKEMTKFNSIKEVEEKFASNVSEYESIEDIKELELFGRFLNCILINDKDCALTFYNELKNINSNYFPYAKAILKNRGYL